MGEFDFETYRVFTDLKNGMFGNTSTVVMLHNEMSDERMQHLAADFCQPATTFVRKVGEKWHVRWFAPDTEIDVCGHGSLAATAFICTNYGQNQLVLEGKSVQITGGKCSSDPTKCYISLRPFPILQELEIPAYLPAALGIPVLNYYETANKHIVLTDSEESVQTMNPDFNLLRTSDTFGYTVTARGHTADFVNRTLVPHAAQLEDPATGSTHAALVPYWAERLDKSYLLSYQLSKRGGKFTCSLEGNEVKLTGAYQKINRGTICSF